MVESAGMKYILVILWLHNLTTDTVEGFPDLTTCMVAEQQMLKVFTPEMRASSITQCKEDKQ